MILIKTGPTEATTNPKTDQNNDNNNIGTGANTFNSNDNSNNVNTNGQAVLPNADKPQLTSPSNQGNNELIYDIDIRFGDSSNNNRTSNQTPLIKFE